MCDTKDLDKMEVTKPAIVKVAGLPFEIKPGTVLYGRKENAILAGLKVRLLD